MLTLMYQTALFQLCTPKLSNLIIAHSCGTLEYGVPPPARRLQYIYRGYIVQYKSQSDADLILHAFYFYDKQLT